MNTLLVQYDDVDKCYVWQKGVVEALSAHFSTQEFSCPCLHPECTRQMISAELIQDLEFVRQDIQMPIGINSGYRCGRYQRDLAARGYETAKGISQHELGCAADIKAHDIFALKAGAQKRFKAIGQGRTFIHVDLRKDKVRLWNYSSH